MRQYGGQTWIWCAESEAEQEDLLRRIAVAALPCPLVQVALAERGGVT